jgi:hypothetical protein
MRRILKIVRKVVLGAILTFAAFAGGDFGIRMLTQDSSPLTADQIKKAKAVFGNTIDYSKVRIAFGRISYFQPPNTSVTIGNTIHYPPPDPPPETKKTNDNKKAPENKPSAPLITIGYSQPDMKKESDLFIHEMSHVWQNQNNIKGTGITGAVVLWAKGMLSSSSRNVYAYTLDSTKTLTDYNIEQQAKIIEDYAIMKRNMAKHPDQPPPKEYATLKRIVEQYIPPAKPHKKPAARPSA